MRSERLATARVEEKLRRADAGALGVIASGDDANARVFAQMQRELQDLLSNYTEETPLVRRKRAQIAQFAANHPALNPPGSNSTSGGDHETGGASSPEVARLEGEIRSLDADRGREQRNVDMLRRRIENMPLRQQE